MPTIAATNMALGASLLKEICDITDALLSAPRCKLTDIPKSQGVYLIYGKDGAIINVTKG